MLSFARRPLSAAVPSGNLLGIHLFQCPVRTYLILCLPFLPPPNAYLIHLSCDAQDAVGIVARLSECIASRGGNIHSVDVFVPDGRPVFYSRRKIESVTEKVFQLAPASASSMSRTAGH